MKDLRTIIFFTAFIFAWTTSWAVAPYGFRGQNQTAVQYSNVLQFPNNQVTKIGGINSLVETGNRNILVNPSFEHETFSTSWTSAGTATNSAETSSPLSGKKSFRISATAQTIQVYQDSTLYASVLSGTQGVIRFSASTTNDVDTTVCQRAAGVELTGANNCVTLVAGGVKRNYEIPVVLSATSNGVEVSAASTTGVTILDDFEISDSLSLPEVSQAQLVASGFFASTASANLSRTSTSLGAFTTVAAFPGPTYNINDWGCATTDANKFVVTCSNVPAGRVVFKAYFSTFVGSAANTSFAIFDGTTTATSQAGGSGTALAPSVVFGDFNYTQGGARSFEPYAASSSSTVTMSVDATGGGGGNPRFEIIYYPPASKIYSQQCQNNPTSCENVFTARLDGTTCALISGSENIAGWITSTSKPGTGHCRVDYSGLGLTVIPNGNVSQVWAGGTKFAELLNPTTTTMDFTSSSVAGALTDTVEYHVSITKQGADFKEKSQITGTFKEVPTTPGYSNPVTYKTMNGGASATLAAPTVCAATPCVEVEDLNSKWSACTRAGTGVYQCIAANGTWANSVSVECECESFSATSGQVSDCSPYNNGNNTWATNSSGGLTIGINTTTKAGVSTDAYFSLWCKANAP